MKTQNYSNRRGGRVTKTQTGDVGSAAPESTETSTVEAPAEVTEAIAEETSDAEPVAPEVTEAPAEQAEIVEQVADPFASLPVTKVEDYEFADLSGASDAGIVESDPRKYENVHKDAKAAKLPVKKNWKHMSDMLVLRTVGQREFKPNSVYGTIQQIIAGYGRSGVPAYVVVVQLRQKAIGNKRSHYADKGLPPIGWGEGWVDTFISKGYATVMAKKAPPISVELVEAVAEGDAKAVEVAESQAA